MEQTAVEWLVSELKKYDSAGLKDQSNYVIEMPTHILTELEEQAKEMEKQQQLELIQFLADREDFKENSSISIFIAEDYLNQFKNK
jgi:hypothetical protein